VLGEGDGAWSRILRGETRRPIERLAARGLWLLSVGYGVALHLHLAGYRAGLARRLRLPALVVSVGNLTLGGTGKTTAALAVAAWLSDQGKRVALLSRGYRGRGERRPAIVSEGFGPLLSVEEAGDEPFMVARKLPGVYVLVGKDRRVTGRMAVDRLGANAIVLDDGFQYQRLQRDLDIVLVDALLPFGYDFLVPRGLLREPPDHLARADAVWLTHSDLVRRPDLEALRARLETLAPRARLWESVHAPLRLRSREGSEELAPEELRGRRVCALSSLGNPVAFLRALQRLGAEVVGEARFPDHHRYRGQDLALVGEGPAAEAEWVVTTEKDAVRLPPAFAEAAAGKEGEVGKPATRPTGKPIWVLEVELAGTKEATSVGEELACLLRAPARPRKDTKQ